MKKTISKIVMVGILLTYAVLNLMYIIQVKGKIQCFGASMILAFIRDRAQAKTNLILFLIFILTLIITYLIIIFSENKLYEEKVELSKDIKDAKLSKDSEQNEKIKDAKLKTNKKADEKEIKKTFIFIFIVSIIAGIILPNNSTDVYYYAAVGRMDSKYGINMYEENFNEHQKDYPDDEVIQASPGIEHKFIYGPLWATICKTIGRIDTNSALGTLYLFKMINIIVHLLNCYLIWKITKNKKLVLYGLNPLMIFEGIINVHNDIFLILFSLLGIYLKKQNKIWLAIISIVLGSLIKYIPILLLPYIINNEKIKNQIIYLAEFAVVFLGLTFAETGNLLSVLNVMDQTGKYANSLYLQVHLSGVNMRVISKIALVGKIIFCIAYFIQIFIRRKKEGKNYMWLMMLFILLVITNFRAWYIMWLFSIFTELEERDINKVIALTLVVEFANYIIYYLGEGYIYGGYYFMMVILPFAIYCIADKICKKRKLLNS